MIKQNVFFIVLLTFSFFNASSQITYNQVDANGKRHGKWKKMFQDTKQIRYEGQFEHGKEVGLFKFYKLVHQKSVLSATKQFNSDNGLAEVIFLASNGRVISKGVMDGKKYVGKWLYYHNNSDVVMTEEHYNDNGKLEGSKIIYFNNGQVAEKLQFIKGKEDGNAKNYSEKGVLLKDYNYKNGELNGPYKDYNKVGDLIVDGQFKEGKKHGRWKFYENGKLIKEKNFSDPKTFHKN